MYNDKIRSVGNISMNSGHLPSFQHNDKSDVHRDIARRRADMARQIYDTPNMDDVLDEINNRRSYNKKGNWVVETGPSVNPMASRQDIVRRHITLSKTQQHICNSLSEHFDNEVFVNKESAKHATEVFTTDLVESVRNKTQQNYFLLENPDQVIICSSPNTKIGNGSMPIPGICTTAKDGSVIVMINGKAMPEVRCEAVCDIKQKDGQERDLEIEREYNMEPESTYKKPLEIQKRRLPSRWEFPEPENEPDGPECDF